MLNSGNLSQKSCVPCQGGVPPMTEKEAAKMLIQLGNGWAINTKGRLYKAYAFDDFVTPVAFVNDIAQLAEAERHHPDLSIAWGRCGVEIWTHKIGGLSESDFILAAKIECIRDESGG